MILTLEDIWPIGHQIKIIAPGPNSRWNAYEDLVRKASGLTGTIMNKGIIKTAETWSYRHPNGHIQEYKKGDNFSIDEMFYIDLTIDPDENY